MDAVRRVESGLLTCNQFATKIALNMLGMHDMPTCFGAPKLLGLP